MAKTTATMQHPQQQQQQQQQQKKLKSQTQKVEEAVFDVEYSLR